MRIISTPLGVQSTAQSLPILAPQAMHHGFEAFVDMGGVQVAPEAVQITDKMASTEMEQEGEETESEPSDRPEGGDTGAKRLIEEWAAPESGKMVPSGFAEPTVGQPDLSGHPEAEITSAIHAEGISEREHVSQAVTEPNEGRDEAVYADSIVVTPLPRASETQSVPANSRNTDTWRLQTTGSNDQGYDPKNLVATDFADVAEGAVWPDPGANTAKALILNAVFPAQTKLEIVRPALAIPAQSSGVDVPSITAEDSAPPAEMRLAVAPSTGDASTTQRLSSQSKYLRSTPAPAELPAVTTLMPSSSMGEASSQADAALRPATDDAAQPPEAARADGRSLLPFRAEMNSPYTVTQSMRKGAWTKSVGLAVDAGKAGAGQGKQPLSEGRQSGVVAGERPMLTQAGVGDGSQVFRNPQPAHNSAIVQIQDADPVVQTVRRSTASDLPSSPDSNIVEQRLSDTSPRPDVTGNNENRNDIPLSGRSERFLLDIVNPKPGSPDRSPEVADMRVSEMPTVAPPLSAALRLGSGEAPTDANLTGQLTHPTRQLAEAIVRSGPELGQTELVLAPEELGKVSFNIRNVDGQLTLSVTAERPETLALLRRNADALTAELTNGGMGDAKLDFGGTGQGGERNRHQAKSHDTAGVTGPITSLAVEQELRPVGPLMSGGRINLRF